jgi:tetratricopeptide (TPR) repeat protein
MRVRLDVLAVMVGVSVGAARGQEAPPQYQTPSRYQQNPPPQYQNPPPQYQYPSGKYPQNPPPQYPQYQYPPPDPRAQPAPPARLALTTTSEEAAVLTWACADALDRGHPAEAQKKCADAMAKDESLALAHALAARATTPEQARMEIDRAVELAKRAQAPERLLVDALRAERDGRTADAKRLLDQVVLAVPGESRPRLWRGRIKRAFGDLEGAARDFQSAVELDPKSAPAVGELALVTAARGQLDEAAALAKKYAELAPSEPDALVVLGRVALKRGQLDEAAAQAKKALALDDKFVAAHALLGDTLLFSGKPREARRAYDLVIAVDDPITHHDGVMREVHAWLYEGRGVDAERALTAEADLAEKTHRPGDQLDALVELARVQLDRGAVTDAGQTLRQAQTLVSTRDLQPPIPDDERRRGSLEVLALRAMVLATVGERALAEARTAELGTALRGHPQQAERTTSLRGWIAARNGDDKTAVIDLAVATRPTMRMALALALLRTGDTARARTIMDELGKRLENDLEGALTRPRALAWLKQQK